MCDEVHRQHNIVIEVNEPWKFYPEICTQDRLRYGVQSRHRLPTHPELLDGEESRNSTPHINVFRTNSKGTEEEEQPVETEFNEEECGCDFLVFTGGYHGTGELDGKEAQFGKQGLNLCKDHFDLEAVHDMENLPLVCQGISETKPVQLSDAADIEEEQLCTTAFSMHKMHLGAAKAGQPYLRRATWCGCKSTVPLVRRRLWQGSSDVDRTAHGTGHKRVALTELLSRKGRLSVMCNSFDRTLAGHSSAARKRR